MNIFKTLKIYDGKAIIMDAEMLAEMLEMLSSVSVSIFALISLIRAGMLTEILESIEHISNHRNYTEILWKNKVY